MGWAPRTLFGRLMLVLASGLILAQAIGVAINLQERDSVVARMSGMRPAQRIADLVKLLDSLAPAERARIAAVLNVPPMSVRLDRAPVEPGPASAGGGPRGMMLGAMLRGAIGDDRPMRVQVTHGTPDAPPAGVLAQARRGFTHESPRIFAQVQLLDGTWATFEINVPESHASLPWRVLGTLAVLVAAVLLLSWIAVRWLTRPLKVLASAADELGRDLYRPPLPETGPQEVVRAAHAFNTMQQRLVQTIEERTRLLAAMSHDLKTPITRMRLRAELLDDEALRARLEADLLEMEAMVTQTLEFMRGLTAEPEEPVDLAALLEQVRADNAAMGRGVTVKPSAVRPFVGSPGLLKRCIANLVDNAVAYGKAAQIEAEDGATSLEIRIRDHGPGIPEADLERVFDPFVRLEPSRNRETGGTGLGLGIARNIARAHGGDVRLRNAAGGGLEAIVTLPRR